MHVKGWAKKSNKYIYLFFFSYKRYIDQALSDSDDNDMDSSFSSIPANNKINNTNNNHNGNNDTMFSTTTSQRSNESTSSNSLALLDNLTYQSALFAATKLDNFVYVLYTLSLLLIGKEKKKVQKSLTKLRLASALNSILYSII